MISAHRVKEVRLSKADRRRYRKVANSIPANLMSNNRYATVCFNWSEMYANVSPTTSGSLYGWVLNRPGPNVQFPAFVSPDALTEHGFYNSPGAWGAGHQPFLWNQVSVDYDEYRVFATQYTLKVENLAGPAIEHPTLGVAHQNLSTVACGITQERHANPGVHLSFTADHENTQPEYIEARNPDWRRRIVRPGESVIFKGLVDMKRVLKPHRYNNDNEGLKSYRWFTIPTADGGGDVALTESVEIGNEDQNQPYYGWGAGVAGISNVLDTGPANTTFIGKDYGRAPQAVFLYLHMEQDQNNPDMQVSLSCKQYIEFKKGDVRYGQS